MTQPNEIHKIFTQKHTKNALISDCLPNLSACSKNFLWSEFIKSQREIPSIAVLENIFALAHTLQALRDNVFKAPIIITSGWRSSSYNKQVGGAPSSYHVLGMACDIKIKSLSPKAVYERLSGHSGGLGLYDSFVHVDIGPKRRW